MMTVDMVDKGALAASRRGTPVPLVLQEHSVGCVEIVTQ
jgi:hypothetical protein